MDLLTARTKVRQRLGELVEDFWSDDELTEDLNEALRRFYSEERWPWMYTEGTFDLEVGETQYPLPYEVAFNRTFNLYISHDSLAQDLVLKRTDPAEGFKLKAAFNSAAEPRWFYVASGTFDSDDIQYVAQMVPSPDKAYTVTYQYVREPEELAGDADQIELPERYIEAIIAWATGNAWLKELNGGAKAQEQFNLYALVLDQAREEAVAGTVDDVIVWGGEEPQLSNRDWDEDYFSDRRLQFPLGP